MLLDPDFVAEQVRELGAVPHFPDPSRNPQAVFAIAREIRQWCVGQSGAKPEDQCRYVIGRALYMRTWGGPASLREIFTDRWPIPEGK